MTTKLQVHVKEPVACGVGLVLCSGIVASFNQFRDFYSAKLYNMFNIIQVFVWLLSFYTSSYLVLFSTFQDLSENHPSQEPMGPCSSERVSQLKIKKEKKNTRVLEWEQRQTGCSGGFFEGCE